MQKREIQDAVDTLINGWILSLRKSPHTTHLDDQYWGTYYWNEREFQWSLFTHMRKHANREGFGSPWAIHAEGSIERPKYARGGRKRHDIVIVDHDDFKRWWKSGRGGSGDYPLECGIELKLTWDHSKATRKMILADIKKLDGAVRRGAVKVGYLVWLDSVGVNEPNVGLPFFPSHEVQELRRGTLARVVHWPDREIPIHDRNDIADAKPGFYPR